MQITATDSGLLVNMNKIGYEQVYIKQKKIIKALIKVQAAMLGILTGWGLLFSDSGMTLSLLIGGSASLFPNMVFAYYSFKRTGASARKNILAGMYLGECLKFILVMCLLVIAYRMSAEIFWLNPKGILSGFGLTYLTVILLPLLIK